MFSLKKKYWKTDWLVGSLEISVNIDTLSHYIEGLWNSSKNLDSRLIDAHFCCGANKPINELDANRFGVVHIPRVHSSRAVETMNLNDILDWWCNRAAREIIIPQMSIHSVSYQLSAEAFYKLPKPCNDTGEKSLFTESQSHESLNPPSHTSTWRRSLRKKTNRLGNVLSQSI